MLRLGTTLRLPPVRALALLVGTALLASTLALAAPAAPARANGTPIRIVLSYLNGVSNFGSQNATGVAELITSEGEVRLTAAGLQKLANDEEYQLWISSSEEKQQLRLGSLQVNEAGVGRLDSVMKQPIPEIAWDLMKISVEAKGAQAAAPAEKTAIAGRFALSQPNGPGPRVLPNTGGAADQALAPTGLLGLNGNGTLVLALVAVGVLAFALGRVVARRATPAAGPTPVRAGATVTTVEKGADR